MYRLRFYVSLLYSVIVVTYISVNTISSANAHSLPTQTGALPSTQTDSAIMAVIGLVLVLGGATAVFVTRKRP